MEQTTPEIQTLLSAIPETERQGFDRYYAIKLREAMQQAEASPDSPLGIDQDRIERQVIDDLIRAAEGRDNADSLGGFPSNGHLFQVTIPERDPRTEAARQGHTRSRTSGTAGEMTPARWAVVGAVLLLLLGYGLMTILRSPATEASADAPPVTATDIPAPSQPPVLPTTLGELGEAGAVTVADPTSLEIRRPDGSSVVLRVVPSSGVLGGSWTPFIDDGQAAWLEDTVINSVFCLSPEADELMDTLKRGSTILMRPASGALRRYEVVRVREVGRQQVEVLDQRRAGMTLLRCGTEATTRTVVEAVYRPDTVQQPLHAVGAPAALADLARIEVQQVEIITPTADLPPGLSLVQLQVEVANLSPAELPWIDLADQLEIGGSVAESVPSVPQAPLGPKETRRVHYRYRVPSAGGEALWRVTAATSESVTIRVPIPPAPQASPLQATLRAEDVQQIGSGNAARLSIRVRVTNSGTAPITLDPPAVGVWQGATALPLHTDTTPLPLIVHGGTSTVLTLVVHQPDDTAAALTVQLGPQRWRVTIP